jgi:acylglycerol lipase
MGGLLVISLAIRNP